MKYIDFIAKLGVAAAHPGGFKATKDMLKILDLPLEAKILEIGCGTGKTACYLAGQGYQVTAIDLHPVMLQKARERGEREQVKVEWVQGNLLSMPFQNNTFDVVLAESVTIFSNISMALLEYFRVLKIGGRLIDCEIANTHPLPNQIYQQFIDYFRISKLLTVKEWEDCLKQAGYNNSQALKMHEMWGSENVTFEDMEEMDIMALTEPASMEALIKYNNLMLHHSDHFGAFVFSADKNQPLIFE